MRNKYPETEGIKSKKIYVDPDEMFDGIEKVYPDKHIISQSRNVVADIDIYSDGGALQCVECGNTGLIGFEHGNGIAHITFTKDGEMNISLEADNIPLGPIKIFDEDRETGLFDILGDFLQQNHLWCMNCGYEISNENYNVESHHDCPGCFLCMRSDFKEAIDFCTEEFFTGRCKPGKDCKKCKGYYNMVKYDIKPKNIMEGAKITGDAKKVLEKMKKDYYAKHNI